MFTPIKNTTISEKVIEQIKTMLYEDKLGKGDRLPSERKMAESLEISRSSVREALKELEIMGLIESKPGEGTFIKENFDDILFHPFSTMFLVKESNPYEILELRKIIEKGSCALAARMITDEELEDIKLLLEKVDSCQDESELTEMDVSFHYKIAQASKNFLLQSILNTISSIIETFIADVRTNILTEPSHKEKISSQHYRIYEMLKLGDPILAEKAMEDHLNYVNLQMQKHLEQKDKSCFITK